MHITCPLVENHDVGNFHATIFKYKSSMPATLYKYRTIQDDLSQRHGMNSAATLQDVG